MIGWILALMCFEVVEHMMTLAAGLQRAKFLCQAFITSIILYRLLREEDENDPSTAY